ncbi:MAG: methyl-accepting chemotaxis protein, partial [Devosia sp.]
TSIEEVTAAVRTMDEMTQHNAALVEETNAAIEQTEAQASELDRIVDIFAIEQSGLERSAAPAPAPRRDAAPASRSAPQAAKTYLSQGNAAISADWDEF